MYYNTKASGARIRELRIAKNFTQDNLAEHMNVSRGFISLIESGKKGCSVDVLIALSNLFGVSIDYLVLGTAAFTEAMAYPVTAKYHLKEIAGLPFNSIASRARSQYELTDYQTSSIQQMHHLASEIEKALKL